MLACSRSIGAAILFIAAWLLAQTMLLVLGVLAMFVVAVVLTELNG